MICNWTKTDVKAAFIKAELIEIIVVIILVVSNKILHDSTPRIPELDRELTCACKS